MKTELDVLPGSIDEDGVVNFTLHISPGEEDLPRLQNFTVSILGRIPFSDSVAEMNRRSLDRAREIIAALGAV